MLDLREPLRAEEKGKEKRKRRKGSEGREIGERKIREKRRKIKGKGRRREKNAQTFIYFWVFSFSFSLLLSFRFISLGYGRAQPNLLERNVAVLRRPKIVPVYFIPTGRPVLCDMRSGIQYHRIERSRKQNSSADNRPTW